MRRGLEELCFADGLFADIVFRLEDGTCSAHKPMLMARLVTFATFLSLNNGEPSPPGGDTDPG